MVSGCTGAARIIRELRACILRCRQSFQRITLREFKRDVVMLGVSVLVVNRILARTALESSFALGLKEANGDQHPLARRGSKLGNFHMENRQKRCVFVVPVSGI